MIKVTSRNENAFMIQIHYGDESEIHMMRYEGYEAYFPDEVKDQLVKHAGQADIEHVRAA